MGFLHMRCCCKSVYEAWTVPTSDTLSIEAFVQLAGAPTSSEAEFTFSDEFNSGTHLFSMALNDVVFVAEQDGSNLSIASYDKDDGSLNWETQSTTLLNLGLTDRYGYYVRGMIPNQGSVSQFCVNNTQVYSDRTDELFESTGTTSTTTPNTAYFPDVEADTDWALNRLSSHDFPIVSASRTYYEENSVTYSHTTGTGPYTHHYDVDYDEVLEVGIGEYDWTDGSIDNVDVVYDYSVNRTDTRTVLDGSPTPPAPAPTLGDWVGAFWPTPWLGNNLGTGPAINNLRNFFSSYEYATQGKYVIVFSFPENDGGGYKQDHALVIVNGNTVLEETTTTASTYNTFQSCALVHDVPTATGYAHALVTYYDPVDDEYRIAGYDASGAEVFEQVLERIASVASVCNGWAHVEYEIDIATETAPDSRDWSNASFPSESNDKVFNWMMRLDGAEWEPFRIETTATSWLREATIAHQGGSGDNSGGTSVRAIKHDLVKTVEHPYGPPLTTYGTTPP